jgi:large subunit ribosomal protein L19
MNEAAKILQSSLTKRNFEFHVGDTVRVFISVKEGSKSRTQTFEGIVISLKGHGAARNFTVRKISYGIGVERVFPVYSPSICDLKVIRKGKVCRSKLYYLRGRVGKRIKVKEDLS